MMMTHHNRMTAVVAPFLILTSMGGPCWGASQANPAQRSTKSPSAAEPVAEVAIQIADAATLKLLMLDLLGKLSAFDFGSRERFGWASEATVRATARKLASKYGITLKGMFIPDSEINTEDDGPAAMTSLWLSNAWSNLVTLPESGRLPLVRFRSGKLSISLKTLVAHFEDGTECMIGSNHYSLVDGKWSRKPGTGQGPRK